MTSARRGLLSIIGGAAGGQVLALACAPVISRLVPPHEYGPFAVINAAVLPVATIAALRLDLAIPVPDSDDEALDLSSLGMRIVLVIGLVTTALVWVLRGWLVQVLHLGIDPSLLVWVPLVASAMGAFTLLNQLAIRWRMYAAIGRRNVLQAGAVSVFQVAAGLAHLGAHGLALGLALGQLVGVVSLARALRKASLLTLRRPTLGWGGLLRSYRTFPLLMAPSGLINSLGLQAPVMLVAVFYGAVVSGWLGMTQRVLALPIALFGIAMSQVYLGEFGAAKRARSTNLERLFLRTSGRLFAVGAVLALALFVVAPPLFALVLGHQWRTSGDYARALSIGLVLQMVASPLSQTVIVMGKVVWQAVWDVLRLLLCGGVVIAGHALGWSAGRSVVGLGVAMAMSYAVLWAMSLLAVQSLPPVSRGRHRLVRHAAPTNPGPADDAPVQM